MFKMSAFLFFILKHHISWFLSCNDYKRFSVLGGRHSRQGSSGSGDSGVYSTEGGSGLRQPNSAQTCSGAEDSWQAPLKPVQVKLLDMTPDPKSQRLIEDKFIVDVCV